MNSKDKPKRETHFLISGWGKLGNDYLFIRKKHDSSLSPGLTSRDRKDV